MADKLDAADGAIEIADDAEGNSEITDEVTVDGTTEIAEDDEVSNEIAEDTADDDTREDGLALADGEVDGEEDGEDTADDRNREPPETADGLALADGEVDGEEDGEDGTDDTDGAPLGNCETELTKSDDTDFIGEILIGETLFDEILSEDEDLGD
jgi:hypothetical protein